MRYRNLVPTLLLAAAAGGPTAVPAFGFTGDPAHVWSNLIPLSESPGISRSGDQQSYAIDPNGDITTVVVVAASDEFGSWYDSFVRRHGPDGSFQWDHVEIGPHKLVDVALDSEGNAIVVGWRDQDPAVRVTKLDNDGDVVWSRLSVEDGRAFAVCVTTDDGVFVAGEFGDAIDLGGGMLTGGPGGAFFVARYDRNGVYQWARPIVVTGRDIDWLSQTMVVDGEGNLFAMGRFSGLAGGQPVDFGGGPFATTNADIFMAAYYGANGWHRFSRSFGSAGVDDAIDVDLHADGDLLVYGHNTAVIDLGGGALAGPGFAAKFDGDGNHVWSRSSGSYGRIGGIASDLDGSVFVAGAFNGTVDLGGGPMQSTGGSDTFLSAFDVDGVHQWSRQFGDANWSYGAGVAVADGGVITGGHLWGTIDFGGGTLSAVGLDFFLTKFSTDPVVVAITSFSADVVAGFVSLRAVFRSDLGVDAVKVYRAEGDAPFSLIDTVYDVGPVTTFEYVDRAVTSGRSYRYQVGVVDADGEFLSPVAVVSVAASMVRLSQNSPNPFNPNTTIRFSLPSRQDVSITVYDASGRLVRTLVDGPYDRGDHEALWDGRDAQGVALGSGVYFYQLRSGKVRESRKMVLLK